MGIGFDVLLEIVLQPVSVLPDHSRGHSLGKLVQQVQVTDRDDTNDAKESADDGHSPSDAPGRVGPIACLGQANSGPTPDIRLEEWVWV
mmetsp:Transcript_91909/g.159456  ORF Transcript_91909/g.159456 Transcript_91909/m.159456 type:complete len:89 (+) Transcript_91909:91-357(+)